MYGQSLRTTEGITITYLMYASTWLCEIAIAITQTNIQVRSVAERDWTNLIKLVGGDGLANELGFL